MEHIMAEDSKLLECAFEISSNLTMFQLQLSDLIKRDTETKSVENAVLKEVIRLQKQMLESKMVEQPIAKQIHVKLPKLEIHFFRGDRLKWVEFWQSFECSIHLNNTLSNIDKFNYGVNLVVKHWAQ